MGGLDLGEKLAVAEEGQPRRREEEDDRRAHRVGMHEANEDSRSLAQVIQEDGGERMQTSDERDDHHGERKESARVNQLFEDAAERKREGQRASRRVE